MVRIKLVGVCGVIGGLTAALFGGWDNALKLLLCLMIADYITGLIVALVFKNSPKTVTGGAESKAGFKGLCRKGVILCLVLIGHRLELATGISYIREAVIYGFSANELISLVENAGLMGVPLPVAVTKAIDILKQRGDVDVNE
jgi:toxin secretion/phage lysis holin